MPWYKWYGSSTYAKGHSPLQYGYTFARHKNMLAELLVREYNMNLLVAEPHDPLISYRTQLTIQHNYFLQLSQLLKAGIRMHEALTLCAQACAHTAIRRMLEDCAEGITEGLLLSDVARYHPILFSPLTIQLLVAAERSGSLEKTTEKIAEHYKSLSDIIHTIRSALLIPLITFIFGIGLFVFMLFAIVPRLATFNPTIHQHAAANSRGILFAAAALVRNPLSWICLMLLAAGLWLMTHKAQRSGSLIATIGKLIPGINSCIHEWEIALYVRTIGVALLGGVDILSALSLNSTTASVSIQKASIRLVKSVCSGVMLSTAFTRFFPELGQEAYTRIRMGEATGKLGEELLNLATSLEKNTINRIERYAALTQPILIIILGIFVASILAMIYYPIMNLGELYAG